jgi:Leucine-rich repeat (LRR) protein
MRSRTRKRKQRGGNIAEAQRRIDEWVAEGYVEKDLDLSYLGLRQLPSLPETLENLYCNENKLTSLPILPANLLILDCSNNKLTSLPTLPESLIYLFCYENRLPPEMDTRMGESMEDYIARVRALQEGDDTPTNVREKDVNANARNYISYNNIQNGNMLVNLKRSANKYNSNYKEYIKYNTWKNVLQKTRKNPISRYAMHANNIKYYTAKKHANAK